MNRVKPSRLNGVRAVYGGILGIFCIFAPFIGLPEYMTIFGIVITIIAIIIAVYNFKNITYQICPNCGAKVEEDLGICHDCGKNLPD